jgi:hypothetical protein
MSPDDIPVEAVEAAAKAMEADDDGLYGLDYYRALSRIALAAAFNALGITVEHAERHAAYPDRQDAGSTGRCHDCAWTGPLRESKDEARLDAVEHALGTYTPYRLTSRWLPLDAKDK